MAPTTKHEHRTNLLMASHAASKREVIEFTREKFHRILHLNLHRASDSELSKSDSRAIIERLQKVLEPQ